MVIEATPFGVDDHLVLGFVNCPVVLGIEFCDFVKLLHVGTVGSCAENSTD